MYNLNNNKINNFIFIDLKLLKVNKNIFVNRYLHKNLFFAKPL